MNNINPQYPYWQSSTRVCPTCKGTGINPVLQTNVCPKCNGETVVAGNGYYCSYPYSYPWTITYNTNTLATSGRPNKLEKL